MNALLAPRLAASTRCLSRKRVPVLAAAARRALSSSAGEQLLETQEDWDEFRSRRASQAILVEHFNQYGSTQTKETAFQARDSLRKPPAPSQTSLSALLASGAHLGHSPSIMNPNFVPYAYGVRAGITIIDLDHTLPLLRRAANLVRAVAARDGSVVFVGTRPDLRLAVEKAAERMGSQGYAVGTRWLPGTLTNKRQMFSTDTVDNIRVVPDLVVILNPLANMPAIRECAIEHVPTIGIVDSNVDPRIVMYPIPANDESTRTAELIAGVLSIAGREGVALKQREDEARNAGRNNWRENRGPREDNRRS
ncbi:hypothetical protein PLICRDRAFT_175283 [Plicaturopsis crispa FD-325 SS-3]|nr:hypothetical protein PLICRDRAFT_175283 [Plicaturopsis crispa FD-325 SS-3]